MNIVNSVKTLKYFLTYWNLEFLMKQGRTHLLNKNLYCYLIEKAKF